MTKEEISEWFLKQFKSCYYVQHNDYKNTFFLYYDEKFIRSYKIKSILNEDLIQKKTQPKGVCLFELDFEENRLYINYDIITMFIIKNYSYNFNTITDMILDNLKIIKMYENYFYDFDITKLTPFMIDDSVKIKKLREEEKLKILI